MATVTYLPGKKNIQIKQKQKQFLSPLLALVCVFSALDADEMFSRFKKTKLNLVSRAFDPLFTLLLGRTNPPPMKKRSMLLHNYEMIFYLSKASPL